MSENNKSGISAWVSGLIGFLVGLFIGLVILGWWLWPVQWSNGAMEILAPEPQAEFLRAAIDSYAYQPDQALARQRFTALGQSGPYVLSTIYAEPRAQAAADIEAFAAAVGATAALENPPAAPPAPLTPELALGRAIASPLTIGLLCGAALLILLIVLLLILRRNRKKASPAPAFAPMQAETAAEDTAPVHVTAAPATSSAEPTGQLPDWLQESAPQELETVELAETGLEQLEGEELREIDLLGGEAEQSLTDEDFDAITSSPFIGEAEEQQLPDFMKAEAGAAAAILAGEALETEAELAEAPAEAEEALAFAAAEEPESIPLESREAEAGGLIEITESHEEAHAKFSQDIQTVAGIGPVYAEKLRAAGIIAPLLLLRNGVTAKGRQQIAEQTGISEKMILKWVNFVDLFRIKGVDELYAELLEAAGVDTVPELATRNPKNLHARLLEVIEQKRPSRTPPELWMVEDWIAQAKKLPRAIHY